jgi:Flp pilus assembly protein TadG
METSRMSQLWWRMHGQTRRLSADTRGLAAIEFAMIVPIMLIFLFGIIQVESGVSVDRKVSQTARTLSDLVSQASTVTDIDISNAFATAVAIMSPYPSSGVKSKVSQVYIDPQTLVAKVKWSKGSNTAARACNETVSVPPALQVPGTYLIMGEATLDYTPIAGQDATLKFLSPTFTLTDKMYTRPRQSLNVAYPTAPACS